MSKLIMLCALAAGCASTGAVRDDHGDVASRAHVRLDLAVPAPAASLAFPAAISSAVPAVNRLSHAVRARLGDVAPAEIRVCVEPSGEVASVELTKSSSFDAFDTALLRDAKGWQFAAMPGPPSVQSCRRTMVAFHPR